MANQIKPVFLLVGTLLIIALICLLGWKFFLGSSTDETKISEQQTSIGLNEKQQMSNRWNAVDCHADIHIDDQFNSIQNNGKNYAFRSCRAEALLPRDHVAYYFEVKIKTRRFSVMNIGIGFATKEMPLTEFVGYKDGTYSYESNGKFWGFAVDGSERSVGRPYIDGKPSFGVGNTVGCGVILATRQIIFTLNGARLDTSNLLVDTLNLYPTVTLGDPSDKVMTNFGPHFAYNLAIGN